MEPSLAGHSCGDAGPSPAASPPVACVYSSVTAPHPLEQGPAQPHRMPTSCLTLPRPGRSHRAAPDSKGGWRMSTAHAPKERTLVVGEWEEVSAARVSYRLRSAGAGGWGWERKSGVSGFLGDADPGRQSQGVRGKCSSEAARACPRHPRGAQRGAQRIFRGPYGVNSPPHCFLLPGGPRELPAWEGQWPTRGGEGPLRLCAGRRRAEEPRPRPVVPNETAGMRAVPGALLASLRLTPALRKVTWEGRSCHSGPPAGRATSCIPPVPPTGTQPLGPLPQHNLSLGTRAFGCEQRGHTPAPAPSSPTAWG